MTMNSFYNLEDLWNRTLENMGMDPIIYNGYFSSSCLSSFNDDKAIVTVPTVIEKSILNESITSIISSLEVVSNKHNLSCDILTKGEYEKLDKRINNFKSFDLSFLGTPLMSHQTFETFFVGNSNRESHTASLGCACSPGKIFNPLFIYGNSGLGKSHLLNAIGNYVIKKDPTKTVYYTDSSKFVSNVVNSIKNKTIDKFKDFMFSVDVLLIDDIQFLANKEKSHEVFFSIFNELVNNRKQIVIVSDRLPSEISGLEQRLISRFASGLSVSIDSPEFETALEITKYKLNIENAAPSTNFSDEALAFIASNFNSDVRKLEGAINKVLFYSIQKGATDIITLEDVTYAVKDIIAISDVTGITPSKIIKCVADYYGINKQSILGKTRTQNITNARHISIYLARKLIDLPYAKIGDEFGGRDHSTIMNACTKVETKLKKDPIFLQAVSEIEKILKHN
ncbi:MAG: chromosomal replication initiator protein DnaA [Anaerorhabdus sp.]